MPVTFIFGKPGGGKSYLAARRVEEELRTTNRSIITNLSLDPGKFNEHMQRICPDLDCGVVQRIIILDEDETKQFWRHRHDRDFNRLLLGPPRESDGATPMPGVPLQPALYVLDEVHIPFNARSWSQTGRGALWYLSQHRKMGDDVILVSQNPEQVDKQLRMLTQDWIHCRNIGKEQLSRFFKLPRRILWRSFASQPTSGREAAQISGSFGIDEKGLGQCYATMAGVGIMASEVKEVDRRRGLPFWVIIIPLILIAYGISKTGDGYKKALAWITGSTQAYHSSIATNTPAALEAQTVVKAPAPSVRAEPRATPATTSKAADAPAPEPPPVKLKAWMKIGNQAYAWLSDGRKVPCEYVGPSGSYVISNGTVYRQFD